MRAEFFRRAFNLTSSYDNYPSYDMLASSFLSFYIYFDKIATTEISEEASMTPVNLIANIGGTMGLFIGISVLSFVEILELCIEMLMLIVQSSYQSRFNNKKTTKKDSKTEIHSKF